MAKKIDWRSVGQTGRELARPVEKAVTNPFRVTYEVVEENLHEGMHSLPVFLGGAVSVIAGIVSGGAVGISVISGMPITSQFATTGLGSFLQAASNLPYFLNVPAGIAIGGVAVAAGGVATAAGLTAAGTITTFSTIAPYQMVKGFISGTKEALANIKNISLTKEVASSAQKNLWQQTSLWARVKQDAHAVMQAITQKLVRMTMPDLELVEKDQLQKLVTVFEAKAGVPLQLPAPQIDHLADYLQAQLGGLPLDARVKILNEKVVPAVSAHLDGAGAEILYRGQAKIADTQAEIDKKLESLREISSHAEVTADVIQRQLNPDPLGDFFLGREEPKPATPRL